MSIYKCYHGTNVDSARSIVEQQHFYPSAADDDWAGSGIYFFIDLGEIIETRACENAKSWAKHIKKYWDNHAVVLSTVDIDDDDILDLTDAHYLGQFHRFRRQLFIEAKRRAQSRGMLLEEKFLKPRKLDCTAINEMCEAFSADPFIAVIVELYIRFHCRGEWGDYPPSQYPNCVVFCLRKNSCIAKTVHA